MYGFHLKQTFAQILLSIPQTFKWKSTFLRKIINFEEATTIDAIPL